MAPKIPFATPDDYEDRGYSHGPWSDDVLQAQLAMASRKIRERAKGIDERIENEDVDADSVMDIVCAMVSRAVPIEGMSIPAGAESFQFGVDVFQQSVRLGSGGATALYFTKEERKVLGIGSSRVAFVDLLGDADG